MGPSLHGELTEEEEGEGEEEEECSELLSSELDRRALRGEHPGEGPMELAAQRRWGNRPRPRLPSELRGSLSADGRFLGSLRSRAPTLFPSFPCSGCWFGD